MRKKYQNPIQDRAKGNPFVPILAYVLGVALALAVVLEVANAFLF